MSPQHGDHDPSKGWYSAVTKAWHRDPTKIGTHVPAPKPEQVEHLRGEWDRMQAKARREVFKPQPQMEQLIKLRDSDRVDDRAKFERIAKGNTRITLSDYEKAKAKAAEQSGSE